MGTFLRCLHMLQMKPGSSVYRMKKFFHFSARGHNQISSVSSVYSLAVVLKCHTLAGTEQRDAPRKHGGSVAGAGGCGSGEARQEEQFPKKDTEQKDAGDERGSSLKPFQGCSCCHREERFHNQSRKEGRKERSCCTT